jgi:cytochrome d ubiquinol oxidase subunit I
MDDLLYARSLMGLSLAFHIVFAAVGVAMPLFMALAEWRWRRTGDGVFLDLARRWAKGTAILFAVGAVSGTVISFELGLLWPRFMQFSGALIGMPFSLEGFAFFTEAIFLGIYLYGWDKVSPRLHLASAFIVAASGAASAFFVTLANAWMNVPRGFELANGIPTKIDPLAAMFPPGWGREVIHVLLSSYVATAFIVAAIHARALLRTPSSHFHRAALGISLSVAALTAVLQTVSGDASARGVATNQPLKLAALEGQFQTERGAPLRIGGIPDEEEHRTSSAIEIPHGLSLLAFHEWNATVKGLDDFPRRDWPSVAYVHVSFQIMVACGSLLALLSLVAAALGLRGRGLPVQRWFLWAVTLAGPLGFVALEAGWMVTELGRQPYVAHGVLRTGDAVTAVRGLAAPFWAFTVLYLFLSVAVAVLLRRQLAAPVEERA